MKTQTTSSRHRHETYKQTSVPVFTLIFTSQYRMQDCKEKSKIDPRNIHCFRSVTKLTKMLKKYKWII